MARFVRLGTESERESAPVVAVLAQLTDDGGSLGRDVQRPVHGCDLATTVTDDVLDTLVPVCPVEALPEVLLERYESLCDGLLLSVPADPAIDDRLRSVIARLRGA